MQTFEPRVMTIRAFWASQIGRWYNVLSLVTFLASYSFIWLVFTKYNFPSFQSQSKFSWLVEFAEVNIDLFEVTASCCPLQLNGAVIARVPTYKLFGVIILQDLTSHEHCDHIHIIGTLRYSDYVLPTTVGCVLPMSGVLGQVLTVGRKKTELSWLTTKCKLR